MALSAGTRLGPYEVVAPLGAGGMGEVYRARDSRLGREVAVKVLPAALASDPERLKRFEKEARSASALNHPNIVTVYDIGSESGVSFIAMELVDGTTLREMLAGGALPTKKLLSIATQVTEGLARAHESGIVHRDLKPENVMVTKDGLVKVLDFGLAKLSSTGSGSGEGSQLPTMTGTTPGVVVGTVGYMSPEQASGEPLDFRSDQFSFGSILYEMATGRRAFLKKTAIDTLGAILNEEPQPIATIAPQTPAPLRWIAERCLAKEPRGRYASTEDLARELESMSSHLSEAVDLQVRGGVAAASRGRLGWAAAAVALLALGVGAGRWLRKTPPPAAPRFQQVTYQKANIKVATFAPDNQTIVYSAHRPDGTLEVLQTRPGSRGSRPVGISGSMVTSISVSGEMALIRDSDGALLTAPLGGGEPRPLAEGVDFADWAPDGKSLAILRNGGRLEFPIGTPLFESAGGRIRVSPQGDRVVFSDGARIAVIDRQKEKTVLVQGGLEFAWAPGGQEIWFTRIVDGSTHLFGVTLSGRERLITSLPGDFTFYGVSRDGRLLFERSFGRAQVFGLFPGDVREHGYNWLDLSSAADLSADGKTMLLVENFALNSPLSYVRRTDGSAAVPLTDGYCGSLSPDGKSALCRSDWQSGNFRLVSTSGEVRDLPTGGLDFPGAGTVWLPNGKRFAFTAHEPGRQHRVYLQSIDGSPPAALTPEGTVTSPGATSSPDGRFVVVRTAGVVALYPVQGGASVPIRGILEGDLPMQWTADGKSLYIRRQDAPTKIWLLDLTSGQRRLFKEIQPPATWIGPGGFLQNLHITPDGSSYVGTCGGFLADLFVLDGAK